MSKKFLFQMLVFFSVKLMLLTCLCVWLVDKVAFNFSQNVHVCVLVFLLLFFFYFLSVWLDCWTHAILWPLQSITPPDEFQSLSA